MKLSIIIPIYNVEQYLRKCVDSVLNQNYEDYEIILVDDGSPDKCPEICDEYAAAHPNIRVIHQKNGGLSAARNSGIEVAQGEYVMFVDSDDYIEPNVLGGLMGQVERDNLDVLRYKHQYVRVVNSEKIKEKREEIKEYEVYNPYKIDPFREHNYSSEVIDGVTFLNTRFGTTCYAWQFIIRRDLIMSIQKSEVSIQTCDDEPCLFTPGIYFEDTDWTPRMLMRAKRVASTDKVVYNYLLTRLGSITNAVNKSKQKKVLDDKMRLVREMQRQAKELEQKGLSNGWFKKMIADTVVSIAGILSTDFYEERENYLEQLKMMQIYPIENRSTKARLINLSPRLAVGLLHFKNA